MATLTPTIKVVSCNDPALDAEAMSAKVKDEARPDADDGKTRLLEYMITRDASLVVTREGMVPAWFTLRRLPLAFLTDVIDLLPTKGAQRRLAFRAACLRVEGDGDPRAPSDTTPAQHGVTLAPDAWAQDIADAFGADVVMEMGETALAASRLRVGARGPFSYWGGSAASP